MFEISKIISGGQTGVDQAALQSALICGKDIGGWCPPGRVCESGIIPREFSMQETPFECSKYALDIPRSLRTEWNVRDSDATLVLNTSLIDIGLAWTIECGFRYKKACKVFNPFDDNASQDILRWLKLTQPQILNIAGPSEGNLPGVFNRVKMILIDVFKEI